MSISLQKKLRVGLSKLGSAGIDVERWLVMLNADPEDMQRLVAAWPGAPGKGTRVIKKFSTELIGGWFQIPLVVINPNHIKGGQGLVCKLIGFRPAPRTSSNPNSEDKEKLAQLVGNTFMVDVTSSGDDYKSTITPSLDIIEKWMLDIEIVEIV